MTRAEYYDKQIEFLTKHPNLIRDAWLNTFGLFQFVKPVGELLRSGFALEMRSQCGCLTMIRQDSIGVAGTRELIDRISVAYTKELTEAITADERIPTHQSKIKVSDLPVLKEWQLRIDTELGREGIPDDWSPIT